MTGTENNCIDHPVFAPETFRFVFAMSYFIFFSVIFQRLSKYSQYFKPKSPYREAVLSRTTFPSIWMDTVDDNSVDNVTGENTKEPMEMDHD